MKNQYETKGIEQSPVLGDVFLCYITLPDGIELWYGRHRVDTPTGVTFQDDVFGIWKPNAYRLSKQEAEQICEKVQGCQMASL